MRAKIVSSILVSALLIGGFVVSVRYIDTSIGLSIIVTYACIGIVFSIIGIIEWLWR